MFAEIICLISHVLSAVFIVNLTTVNVPYAMYYVLGFSLIRIPVMSTINSKQ